MNKGRISIHILTKDRWSECGMLLESLRKSNNQNWDLLIVDNASGNPLTNCYFLINLFNRLKLEGHQVKIIRQDLSFGVAHGRQTAIDNDFYDNEYIMRLDDDVVIEKYYIDKLLEVINKGYDIASGITPPIAHPELVRPNKNIHPIINRIDLDKDGNIINYADDCGYAYEKEEILPADNFRSCALIKSEVFKKIKYQENLSPVGFREEAFLSVRAILNNFTIGVHTGATAYHHLCPSGGCRYPNYPQLVQSDHELFVRYLKNNFKFSGDFISEYHKKVLGEKNEN